MSPSKLDPHQKARDFRRTKRRHKRHNEKPPLPVHVDVTSVTYASQLVDDGSRFTVLDMLPDMEEGWVNEVVFIRSPTTGTPDRSFMGIQMLDDSLAWIELTLAAPAPPNEGNDPAPTPDPSGITFIRHYGDGILGGTSDLYSVSGIALDSSGNIWVSDFINNRVFSINPITGARGTTIAAEYPTGLAIDTGTDKIFIHESRNNWGSVAGQTAKNSRVRAYSHTGTLLGSMTPGSTYAAEGVTVAGAGSIVYFVSESPPRVYKGTVSSFAVTTQFTVQPADSFTLPKSISMHTDGSLLITDRNDSQVLVYTSTGTETAQIGTAAFCLSTDGNFCAPRDVWVDASNRLYVADRDNHRVQIFNATTRAFKAKFGTLGTGDGNFQNPAGITGKDLGGGASRIFVYDQGGGGITSRVSVWDIDNTV